MDHNIRQVRIMKKGDVSRIAIAFSEPLKIDCNFEWYINRCYEENKAKERITFIALLNNEIAGFVNIIFKSLYPYFLENNIPEINDLRVLEKYRRNGLGKMLIDECERFVSSEYEYVGLGVGLYKDYGSAQRLYTKNGYILDGNGLMYNNVEVNPGTDVFVDDELLLYLIKKIR